MARVTKDSAVERKLRAVEDELNALKKGMKSLSKEMGKRRPMEDEPLETLPPQEEPPIPMEALELPVERKPAPSPAVSSVDELASRPRAAAGRPAPSQDRIHEGRFADYYIANSYRSSRPLRHEMKIQRARAIFMLIVAVLILTWFLYMYGSAFTGHFSGESATAPVPVSR